jgi:hypothetical protein
VRLFILSENSPVKRKGAQILANSEAFFPLVPHYLISPATLFIINAVELLKAKSTDKIDNYRCHL